MMIKKRKGDFYNDAYTLTRTVHPAYTSWSWLKLFVPPNAPSRGHQTAVFYQGNIILFGGEQKRKRFNDVYVIYFA